MPADSADASGAGSTTLEGVAYKSPAGRWVLAIAVLGSGMAFLDGTVVNVALPDLGRDLHASTAALQWVLNGYLLTLASLILLGGSLGDRYGRRRVFVVGVGIFTAASLLCTIANCSLRACCASASWARRSVAVMCKAVSANRAPSSSASAPPPNRSPRISARCTCRSA